MEKHPWEKVYNENKFKITTLEPSVLVKKYRNKFSADDHVLDVGCGNGRNSVYLARLGCTIDSFDVADLKWIYPLPSELKNKINFTKVDITRFPYAPRKYSRVIITRVIQYLDKIELAYLLDQVCRGLKSDGFLLLNFTARGGIFDREEIQIPKFKYSKEEIKAILKSRFRNILITKGSDRSQNVNYESKISSYDIYASDPSTSIEKSSRT